MTAPLVVIGTGLAGYNLVKEFRKADPERAVIMITSDDGRQYSKPMLSTGFSKGKDDAGLSMNDAGAMAEQLRIEIRTHQSITGINPAQKQVLLGDETLVYGDLVLALGAEPIQLPIEGAEHLFHVNDLMDYAKFYEAVQGKKRILVLGAGLVGCEYAHDLASAGFEVDLVAPDTQPLSRLIPAQCGEALIPALEALGAKLHLEKAVTSVTKDGDTYTAQLSDGSTLSADVVLSAVGLRPRTTLAQQAGLEIKQGIVTDRTLKTSDDNIYALGDCAEVAGMNLLYVLPLMNCARALAKTLSGTVTEVMYPVMPVAVKTPTLPVVTCPVAQDAQGEWEITGESPHFKGVFKDSDGKLLGYVLTGDCVAEKMAMNKQLPAMLA